MIRISTDLVLRDRPIDEKNGVNASLGYTFQQRWATLSIAEFFGRGDDFDIGIEIKEDIAILDSAQSPTNVDFCQAKKHERDGAWVLEVREYWCRRLSIHPSPFNKATVNNLLQAYVACKNTAFIYPLLSEQQYYFSEFI